MTKLLDKAIEAVRGLTPEEQDEIAEVILAMAASDDAAAGTKEEAGDYSQIRGW